MTNDPQPLINGLTRSETDASASVAGVSAPPVDLHDLVSEAISLTESAAHPLNGGMRRQATQARTEAFSAIHDAQSRIASLTDARDGWKLLAERSVDVVNSLTADLAEARAKVEHLQKLIREANAANLRSECLPPLKAAATAPRVPLTPSQIMAECPYSTQSCRGAYAAGARNAERHHGIGAIPGDDAKAVGGEASRG